jgi:adenosine kinase
MLLKNHPNVLVDGLIPLDQKNHEVILEYVSPEERKEKALFNFPPLDWKKIKAFLKADFYLVNLITGWDLSLPAYKKLSKKYYDKMYIDIHFLVMGIDDMGRRYPRRPEDIDAWLRGARFVQMNKREFSIICGKETHEIDFFERNFRDDQILIITLGSNGARIIFRKNGMTRDKHFSAYKLEKIVDTTGCGDVFGASFVWHYLRNEDIYQSVQYANLVAAANCLLQGTNEIDDLKIRMEEISQAS